jgi:hypothetical protein
MNVLQSVERKLSLFDRWMPPAPPPLTTEQETLTFQRIKLYPKQAAIIDDPHRFTITEATTKAGKTASHIEWLLDEAIKTGRGNFWWVATVSDTADIAFRRSQDRLRGYLDSGGQLERVAEPIAFEKNETRKFIKVNGATVWFKSADKPDSLYGEDVYAAVGDEVSRWKHQAWVALYSTLTATRGRAKLIGNVKGRRNWAYLQARKAEAKEPDWGYHKLTAYDAIDGGVVEAGIVEQARRDLPPEVFKELYEAEAADDSGNPFGLPAINACYRERQSTAKPAVFGVDLAKSVDWTWVIGLDADGNECVSKRWQGPWGETKKKILELTNGVPTLVDSTGVGDPIVEELQEKHAHLEGYKFSQPSKQQLMLGLASALQSETLHFSDPVLKLELEAFEYQYTRTGVSYSAPEGMHDDGVVALSLAERMRQTYVPITLPPDPVNWNPEPHDWD